MAMNEVSIKAMFDDLLFDLDLGGLKYQADFIKDLKRYFDANGKLSEKQESALRRIYRTHMGS